MKRYKSCIALILAAAIAFSAVGCSAFETKSKSKSKGKDKDEDGLFKEKDVISLAEDFGKSLVKRDYEALGDISDIDNPSEYMFDVEYTEDVWNVVNAWYDTFTYEVDEDSVEMDDEEATVSLKIIYADVDSLDVTDKSVDGWKEALSEAEDTDSTTFELNMKYDEDDEKLKVEDAADILVDFQTISASFDIEDVDYSSALSLRIDAIYTTDDIVISVTCYDVSSADGKEVSLSVSDPEGNEILSEKFDFESGAESTYTIEHPTNGKFDSGFYEAMLNLEGSLSFYSFELVEPESEPDQLEPDGSDILPGLDSSLSAAPDEAKGTYDMSADKYTNEYFGFEISFEQKFMSFEGDMLSDGTDGDMEGIDLVSMYMDSTTNSSGDLNMAIIMVMKADVETSQVFQMLTVSGEAEEVDINGVSMLCADNNGIPIYLITKDDCVLFITFSSSDQDMIDAFLEGMKPL